jgi:hypothetical protein
MLHLALYCILMFVNISFIVKMLCLCLHKKQASLSWPRVCVLITRCIRCGWSASILNGPCGRPTENYLQGEPYYVLGSPVRALCNMRVEIIVSEWRNIV